MPFRFLSPWTSLLSQGWNEDLEVIHCDTGMPRGLFPLEHSCCPFYFLLSIHGSCLFPSLSPHILSVHLLLFQLVKRFHFGGRERERERSRSESVSHDTQRHFNFMPEASGRLDGKHEQLYIIFCGSSVVPYWEKEGRRNRLEAGRG